MITSSESSQNLWWEVGEAENCAETREDSVPTPTIGLLFLSQGRAMVAFSHHLRGLTP